MSVRSIEDPAFRAQLLAIAATGVSRRTVAALAGVTSATIRGWVERGMAFPDIEPYGSFSRDYRQAERVLAVRITETLELFKRISRRGRKRRANG